MKLNGLFRDGAVLQAGKPVRIFGEGAGNISVSFLGRKATACSSGESWLVELPACPYGGPYEMKITLDGEETVLHDIWLGDVYIISGQSNMQFKLRESDVPAEDYRSNSFVRLYSTETYKYERFTPADGWLECRAGYAGDWSCIGYLASNFLTEKKPGVMIGLITCYIGAAAIQAFLPERVFEAEPELIVPEDKRYDMAYPWNKGCSQIYHFIWEKIIPYSAAGIVYYQGESNYSPAEGPLYGRMLEALIREWRKDMLDEALPFVLVQIADYYKRTAEPWHQIQEAQLDAGRRIKNVKTVVSRDVCEDTLIHPTHKAELSRRIADALLALSKNKNSVGYVSTERGSFTASDGTVFGYLIQRTGPDVDRPLPMLVYLHGGDGLGTDPGKLLNIECVPQYLANGKLKVKTSAVYLAPQCPPGKKWYTVQKQLIELIKDIAPRVNADPDRISLTGCSLGGMGTFAAAIEEPELFSCAVPVCSSVDPEKCSVLTGLPVWVFHGELDSGMGFSAVEANCVINRAGGRSKLTMLPGEGHEIRHVYHDGRRLVKWMLDRRKGELAGEKKCIFIGSSVCVGTGAADDRGWSRMLADRLNAEGISTENLSIGGQTTTDILQRLDADVISRRPAYCVIGLGIANEGLPKTATPDEAEECRAAFDSNMKRIISALKKAGIKVAAGGVYPNNKYNDFQYAALLKEEKASEKWGVPVFDWLSSVEDGSGHWKEGLFSDAGHPSDEGYKAMYSAIPDTTEIF